LCLVLSGPWDGAASDSRPAKLTKAAVMRAELVSISWAVTRRRARADPLCSSDKGSYAESEQWVTRKKPKPGARERARKVLSRRLFFPER
jgi:hypothetical protein